MSLNLRFPKLSTALLLSIILTSCSKDADLLSEYVINDTDQYSEIGILIRNDFVTTQPNQGISSVLMYCLMMIFLIGKT